MPTTTTEPPIRSTTTLEANLAALSACSPRTAALILETKAIGGDRLVFQDTDDAGAASASLDGRALSSRRRPIEEGERLAGTVDLKEAGAVVVLGFGLGHHVAALARRMKRDGMIIVFEPDVGLLRAVFERVEHFAWMRQCNIRFLTSADDSPAMSEATRGGEGVLALGIHILEHPPSRARLGDAAARFGEKFSKIVAAVRTVVVTTMVQTEVTVRNLLMNVDHYCRSSRDGGVSELEGLCAGRPAIVVSAGPSLRRNVHLLKTPGLRDRCVIIAVQTVLKQLLAMGVKPHFVTALDYHEISRRFYEGLTPADCEGVTLVAEAKANPAILDAFPGSIRCVGDDFIDAVLGPDLAGDHGRVPPGATVAHLAHYLARHLGCDPVALIGQDLGFTDGQYYAAGAAIHDVWACELNSFNTLEMMEWQRIVRGRHTLARATDHLGRRVYTDEQMATYLAQFERDFAADERRGLSVIDATEGGVAKAHARAMTLREVIEQFAGEGATRLPTIPLPTPQLDGQRRELARKRLREVRAGCVMVAKLSRQARDVLGRMLERQDDQRLVNKLIGEVEALRLRVVKLDPAYGLVQKLNQTGGFNRSRADRRLRQDEDLTPLERQRRQIERDQVNVTWLADAADALATTLEEAIAALAGAAKRTRDPATPEPAHDTHRRPDDPTSAIASRKGLRVAAVIAVESADSDFKCPHAQAPDLEITPLRGVLERLARCKHLDRVILLSDDPERTKTLVGDGAGSIRTEVFATPGPPKGGRAAGIRAARLWADASWRGGLCSMTCYDEVLAADHAAAALAAFAMDAALIVGDDWILVDPELCDLCIERWRERPEKNRVTFCQAPPGLAGCVLDRSILAELAASQEQAGVFATIGGLLGYVPVNPMVDPIAQQVCVQIPPGVRDARVSCIPRAWPKSDDLERALDTAGGGRGWAGVVGLDSQRVARALSDWFDGATEALPKETTVEPCTSGRDRGERAAWACADRQTIRRFDMSPDLADRIFTALGETRADAVVNFAGLGDPLTHPRCAEFVRLAKARGVAGVHVRTDLLAPVEVLDDLLESGVDIISVDVLANTAATYETLTGVDAFQTLLTNLERMLKRRGVRNGMPHPWIVPRITRCDTVYEEIEAFYDKWLLVAGAAVIDSTPFAIEGARISPLGKPNTAKRRDWRRRMLILSDGGVVADERNLAGSGVIGNAGVDGLGNVWRRLASTRIAAFRAHGDDHPDLWTGW